MHAASADQRQAFPMNDDQLLEPGADARQQRSAEEERRQTELVAFVALLDLHGVDPRPSQHGVFAAAPLGVGFATLVQPSSSSSRFSLSSPPRPALGGLAGSGSASLIAAG